MDGLKLILNDGTEIDGGRAGYAQGFLWLHFTGYSFFDAAMMFSDSTKTQHIIFQYGEMQDVFDGFTECVHVSIDMDGQVSVCLTKG